MNMCPRWMSKKQAHSGNSKSICSTVAKVTVGKSYVTNSEKASMSPGIGIDF